MTYEEFLECISRLALVKFVNNSPLEDKVSARPLLSVVEVCRA